MRSGVVGAFVAMGGKSSDFIGACVLQICSAVAKGM